MATPIGPPTGSWTRTGPSGSRSGPCSRTANASTRARGRRRGRRRPARPGPRWPAPPPRPAIVASSRSATSTSCPVSSVTPKAWHSARSHAASSASRVRPGPAEARPRAPLRVAPPARRSAPGGPVRPGPGRTRDRRARRRPRARRVPDLVGAVGVGLDGLVAAAGLAHAGDHRIPVVPDAAGLVAEDARAGRGGRGRRRTRSTSLGLGDLRPGHLHQVGTRAVGEGGLRPPPARPRCPAARPGCARPPRRAHPAAQVEVEGGRGVGVGPVGRRREGPTPHHHDQVDQLGEGRHLLGGHVGGDAGPGGQLVAGQTERQDGPWPRPVRTAPSTSPVRRRRSVPYPS